jgi:hypothetical protein
MHKGQRKSSIIHDLHYSHCHVQKMDRYMPSIGYRKQEMDTCIWAIENNKNLQFIEFQILGQIIGYMQHNFI